MASASPTQANPSRARSRRPKPGDYGQAFLVSLRGQIAAMVRTHGEDATRRLVEEAVDLARRYP